MTSSGHEPQKPFWERFGIGAPLIYALGTALIVAAFSFGLRFGVADTSGAQVRADLTRTQALTQQLLLDLVEQKSIVAGLRSRVDSLAAIDRQQGQQEAVIASIRQDLAALRQQAAESNRETRMAIEALRNDLSGYLRRQRTEPGSYPNPFDEAGLPTSEDPCSKPKPDPRLCET